MTIVLDRPGLGAGLSAEWLNPADREVPRTEHAPRTARYAVPVSPGAPMASPPQLATPSTHKEVVSQQQATEALNRLLRQVEVTAGQNGGERPLSLNLPSLEKIPMDSMVLASTLLAGQVLGDTAAAKSKALDIMSDKQERLRQQEVDDYRAQMDAAVEQQDKAKKAGIMSVVFDWVIAAVEVVTGVAKIIGGAMTGNVMMAAGGAMDLMAGLSGVVKAMANTMALIDPDNAEKYRGVAAAAGKAQMAFEIAGAVVDITSAARNMLVTKIVPKVAGQVMKEGAGQILSAAIKEGSQSAVKGIAQSVGKEVAGQVAGQLAQSLGKTSLEASKKAGKEMVENALRSAERLVPQLGKGVVEGSKQVAKQAMDEVFSSRMLEKFSREAIEKMVSKSVEKVASQAIERGLQVTAEEISKQVVRDITQQVIKVTAKATLFNTANVVSGVVRGSANGARELTAGVINKQKAELQKQIDELILDQQWLQSCFELYEQQKKEAVKRVRELLDGQAEVMEDGTRLMSQTASTQAQMASSMV